MVLKKVREIFKELCDIEIETLKNENMSAKEAKVLYDIVISLHKKFVENQIQHVKFYDYDNSFHSYYNNIDDEYYDDYPHIFDSIHQKSTDLRKTLRQIFQTNADESTSSENQLNNRRNTENTIDQSDSFSRNHTMFSRIIESLEWNSYPTPAEAKILLHQLQVAHESYVNSQQNIAHCVNNDSYFEKKFDLERRVILLQNKLKRIVSPNESGSILSVTESNTKLGNYWIFFIQFYVLFSRANHLFYS